ncbi:Histidine triad nucleotide-binding protein 1 [Orobanche gracilis]
MSKEENPSRSRLIVLASHLASSSSPQTTTMASEKEAALAAAPSDSPTLFDKIINKQIPANIVYEDDKVLAFRDISPQAPTHILLIPKVKDGLTRIASVRSKILTYPFTQSHGPHRTSYGASICLMAEEKHCAILGYLLYTAKIIAKQEGLDDGFRHVINDGPHGCQSVYHLHVRLLGGRQMNWPPG